MAILTSIFLSVLVTLLTYSHISMANDITLTNLATGAAMNLDTEAKRPRVFYFWATWCPDCKAKLKSDLSRYNSNGLDLITLPTDKDVEKIKEYVRLHDIKWTVALDANRALQKRFKVFSVPTVVIARYENSEWIPDAIVTGTNWEKIDQQIRQQKKE